MTRVGWRQVTRAEDDPPGGLTPYAYRGQLVRLEFEPNYLLPATTGAMLRVGVRHGRGSRRLLSRSHQIPERQEPRSD
jgi:hypothetical protein